MFVNMLALRSHPESAKKFIDYLRELAKETAAALENRDYRLEQLVEKLTINRDTGRNPLFDVVFSMQHNDIPSIEIPGLKLTPVEYHTGAAKFDLTFECEVSDPELRFMVEYSAGLFMQATIRRYISYFREIVKAVLADNLVEIGKIELIPAAEKRRLLYEFNDTGEEYPADKTIHELFVRQVERTPANIALVYAGEQLTYRQLDERSNRLAHSLLKQGVRPDDLAALLVERTLEMGIGILGILKSGCGYVPLNPKAPVSRNRFIMQECCVKILLTAAHISKQSSPEKEIDYVETESPVLENIHMIAGLPGEAPAISAAGTAKPSTGESDPEARAEGLPEPDPTHRAYVIFTSGSTGKPKGVAITHANFCPLVHWGYRELGIGAAERTIRNLSYYFDWSVWEMFITLTTGSALYLVSNEVLLDPAVCIDFITANGITILHVTPTQYQYIVAQEKKLPTLKYLFIGAEKLTYDLTERSFASVNEECRVFNMYGPTEATIIAAVLEIDREEYKDFKRLSSIPIGKAAAGLRLFVLDKNYRLCPVNVIGELVIAGAGVAEGYLNRPKLTKESFIEEYRIQDIAFIPAGARRAEPERRGDSALLYKTGDLVRRLPDGNIEFLGRKDYQVKIRGFRIEPGEIENELLRHEEVKEAVVIDFSTAEGEKYLCAYIVAKSPESETGAAGLRRHLSLTLPNYMIPSYFMFIANIPLNPNGKVNRRALPKPDTAGTTAGYVSPGTGLEEKLVAIWSEVLHIDPGSISIDSSFFEIGGHSLKVNSLAAKIHKELNVSLKLSEIFRLPTITALATYIKDAVPDEFKSIAPAVEKDFYPLSAAQERMYILQQLDTNSTVYNIPILMLAEGEINREKFAGVFKKLIERHESLRTSFEMTADAPVQKIHKPDDIEFEIEYYETGIGKKQETKPAAAQPAVPEEQIERFIRPFDLSQAPLLRVGLIKSSAPASAGNALSHILIVDQHHIISDGHSVGIMIKEFISLLKGENLPPLSFQYKDYSEWLSARQGEEALKIQENFWLEEFAGEIPVLDLPTDFPRPEIQAFAGKHLSFEISEAGIEALKGLAAQENATLYMVLLAVFDILLSKLSGQKDIVVGTAAAGRKHEDLSQILGMFVNTLTLRNYPSGEKPFLDFLREVRDRASAAFENQEYSFEDLVERTAVIRDTSRNPLFDVMLAKQDMDTAAIDIPGLKLVPFEYESNIAKFDLTLQMLEVGGNLRLSFEYSTSLFREETILRFTSYFRKIISAVITDPEMKISGIEIISEEEKREILNKFNDTQTSFTGDKTIHEIFAEQAAKNPHRTVLVYENYHLSFAEVNRASNKPAQFLRSKGVRPGTIVGIMVERSIEMITGILSILKSGGAYMPVNPDYPEERIRLILKDSGAGFLITDRPQIAGIDFAGEVVHIGGDVSYPVLDSPKTFDIVDTPTNLAYVIYTSGSTGAPKGTLIEHRSVVNILENLEALYPLKEYGAYLMKTNYMFDVSVMEIFGWIFGAGKLAILEAGMEGDAEAIAAAVRRDKVTHINFVPAMLKVFLDSLAEDKKEIPVSLEYILAAGEAFPASLAKRAALFGTAIRFENIYGPTEATIYTTGYSLDLRKEINKVPIGKPLNNINNYIIDEFLHLQPLNISGELCIGGTGLARGYLNRPELTRDRFIDSPFIKGEKLYRTGDLTHWQPDGNIEYLGRMDQQVKVRGFRIELQEIENRLLSLKKVKEVVLTAGKAEDGDTYLSAYIVLQNAETKIDVGVGAGADVPGVPGTAELREYLSKHLPAYMIPSHFIFLDSIPHTPNGKIDRKALTVPVSGGVEVEYAAPRYHVEKELAKIWSEVLNVDRKSIGIDANFFVLGGHSLKATIVLSRIFKLFDVKVTLKELFKTPTIRRLAGYIQAAEVKEKFLSIKPVRVKDYYSLSSAQKRLYILQRMEPEDTNYNIYSVWKLTGKPDIVKMEETIGKLVERHESLRTSFEMIKGDPVQQVHAPGDMEFKIEYYETGNKEQGAGIRKKQETKPAAAQPAVSAENEIPGIIGRFIRPFDLTKAPLLRIGLIPLAGGTHILMVDMHHIISDGTSLELFSREFMEIYAGRELPPLNIHYKDYSEWQNSAAEKERIKRQEDYWRKQFADRVPLLDLPYDYPRPAVKSYEGSTLFFEVDEEKTAALRRTALASRTTLYTVLLTIYYVFLAKISGREDIVTGAPTAGRLHADLERVIGMFVNTLGLRNFPAGHKSFREFLDEVRLQVLEAFENQDYPFEDLVETLDVSRDTSRSPLFDVMFSLQNMGTTGIDIPGLELTPYEYENKTSKFDLILMGFEVEDRLRFSLEYSTNLFKEDKIDRFIGYFKNIITIVSEDVDIKLNNIKIASDLIAPKPEMFQEIGGDFGF
jgi:amino acid adenylation domain-containing protein